jgi:uncharacterized oxidoreductase
MRITNNTVLITGGGSGIGLELAKQLHARGNRIIITGRDAAKLEKAKSLLPGLEAIPSDVARPREIEALRARIVRDFPETNVLINNAGIMRTINLHEAQGDLEELTREVEINLNGTIRMTREFLPHLKSKPEAAIVNVTSGLAFVPLPTSPVYCATKAALHSFTMSLRVQLQLTRVKVFELAPPATYTELISKADPEDLKGASIMKVDAMVADAVKGMSRDVFEIRPGQSNQLKFMSRLAPDFILKQLSKPVERMLAKMKP